MGLHGTSSAIPSHWQRTIGIEGFLHGDSILLFLGGPAFAQLASSLWGPHHKTW